MSCNKDFDGYVYARQARWMRSLPASVIPTTIVRGSGVAASHDGALRRILDCVPRVLVTAGSSGLGAGPLRAAERTERRRHYPDPSIATSLPQNGDPAGIRKRLSDRGITYNLIYTNDVLSNLSGGNKRGTIDQGKLEGQLTVDLAKLAGWQDLTLYANAFQIHNTGRIRRDYVGGMNTIAAIEAAPSTRLSELWLERKFLDGAASFRIGQLAADSEFFFSDLSNMFMQSDWPTIAAVNLPGGGPAYPLSTPGARVKFDVGKEASFLLAIFNGDPAGPCAGDPDTCNRYGLNFRMRDPAFHHRRGAIPDQSRQRRYRACPNAEARRLEPSRPVQRSALRQ